MSDHLNQNEPVEPKPPSAAGKSTDQLRRRLLRGGLVGAPIMLSLTSRSVMACTSAAPSAWCSTILSRPEMLVTVNGQPPSYWCENTSSWPSPYCAVTTHGPGAKTASMFNKCFSPTKFPTTCTLLNALNLTGGCSDITAQYLAAALLNAASGRTSVVLDTGAVQNMWYEYASKGYFEPIAGVKWYSTSASNSGTGITGYLKSTWT